MAEEGMPKVGGEYLIPPSEIHAAISRAESHHREVVDAQLEAIGHRLDAMDREHARLYVIVQDDIPQAIAHALNEGVTIVRAEMATILQRIDDMDRADRLLRDTVNRVPTELQREIQHVRERMQLVADELGAKIYAHAVLDLKSFDTVDLRFAERDKRFEIQSIDNQKAIDKAERATKEAIDKNADLANKSLEGVRDIVNDLKDRVAVIEAEKRGVREHGFDQRAIIALSISGVLVLIAIITFVMALAENGGTTP